MDVVADSGAAKAAEEECNSLWTGPTECHIHDLLTKPSHQHCRLKGTVKALINKVQASNGEPSGRDIKDFVSTVRLQPSTESPKDIGKPPD